MLTVVLKTYAIPTVSESSGGHDPSFRKGVRRGVKARFQNVFDVGGFYVECQSEKVIDDVLDNSEVEQNAEQEEVSDNQQSIKIQKQTRSRIAARTTRRNSSLSALNTNMNMDTNNATLGD